MLMRILLSSILVWGFSCHPAFAVNTPEITEHKGVLQIHLYGTRQQMFKQYGELIKSRIHLSALDFYANKIIRNIEINKPGAVGSVVKAFVTNFIYPKMRSNFSDEDLNLLETFADQVGLSRDTVVNAILFPDVGEYLLAKLYGNQTILDNFKLPAMGFGCTTFVVLPDSVDGKLIHARNLDYFGIGTWDKHQTITYYHTTEPNEVAYASISSLGNPLAGPTVFNEMGIVIDLHQNTVNQVSLTGTPVLSILDYTIRHAKTLEHAVSILSSFKFTTPWKFNISSAKENRAMMVEVSADAMAFHPTVAGMLIETNHVRTKPMKIAEFSPGQQYAEDSVMREFNVFKQLASLKTVTKQDAVDIISSSINWAGGLDTESSMHGVVSRINNVQSLVFVPEEEAVYVAVPKFDFAKPTEGEFIPFTTSFSTKINPLKPVLQKTKSLARNQILAQAEYRKADVEITENGFIAKGLGHLEKSMELDPSDAHYPLMAGLTAFKMAGQLWKQDRSAALGLFHKGLSHFKVSYELGLSPYHLSIVQLFTARFLFGINKDREANELVSKIKLGMSSVLDRATSEAKNKGFKLEDYSKLIISYSEADVLGF